MAKEGKKDKNMHKRNKEKALKLLGGKDFSTKDILFIKLKKDKDKDKDKKR
jgi:hypothetical protein